MESTIKTLAKGRIELTITVPATDVKRELDEAVVHLSTEHTIAGYRPGKAPYDIVKQRFGEMVIYEHALTDIVRKNYVAAVTKSELMTYGQPEINITKLVPGNPIEFTATVAVVPKVLSVPDYASMKVASKTQTVEEKAVDAALADLQKMQTKENKVDRPAGEHDKVIVDMDLTLDKVPLEGGQARNHGIYLDEEYYIPGIKEQVLGMKADEKKNFTLKFPDTHYQKNIAGRDVEFALTMKEVYELVPPPLDEAFAKTLGQESMAKVRELIKKNLQDEADLKERQRVEIEVLDKVVEKAKIEEVPDAMLETEIDRMVAELKDSLAQRGVEFDDYMRNIKKDVETIRKDFAVQAEKRVKTALLVRQVGNDKNVEVSDAEVLEEVTKLMNSYAGNAEVQEQLRTEDYQDYLRSTLRNRKVVDLLRETVVKK